MKLPDKKVIGRYDMIAGINYINGWNDCLNEIAAKNKKRSKDALHRKKSK
jgi:hypothetical protein